MPTKGSPTKSKRRSNLKKTKRGHDASDEDIAMDNQGSGQAVASDMQQTVGLNKHMDEFYDLEDRSREAFLGYAKTDITQRNLTFGEYNSRMLNKEESKSLMDSFICNGLRRFEYAHAINLIIDKDQLEEELSTEMMNSGDIGRRGEGIPDLKLKGDEKVMEIRDEKKTTRKVYGPAIIAGGGRHRHHVLTRWVNDKNTALKMQDSRRKELQTAADKQEISQEDANLAKARHEVMMLRGEIETGGTWMVAVYDKEKVDAAIGLHLSTNQRLYSYAETAEEGVIQMFKMMQSQGKKWTDVHIEAGLRSQKAGYKIRILLQQDYVWKLLNTIVGQSNEHYTHSNIFKITQLTSDLLSEQGGMLATLVMSLEERLRLCFNDYKDWDDEEVEKQLMVLAERTSTMEERNAADHFLNAELKALTKEAPMFTIISDDLRKVIDKAYRNTLGKGDLWQQFGMDTKEWKSAYREYADEVVEAMEEAYEAMKDEGRLINADEATVKAWESCASKARLLLNIEYTVFTQPYMPFMSASVWKSLSQQLRRAPKALMEVSSWFSPLMYNHKVIGSKWKVGSATADMLRAVAAHPDLRRTQTTKCMDTVVFTLLSNFPALLRMEEELDEADMPLRPDSAKQIKDCMLMEGESKPAHRRGKAVQTRASGQSSQPHDGERRDVSENPTLHEIVKEVTFVDNLLKSVIKEVTKDGSAPEHKSAAWGKSWSRKIKLPPAPSNPLARTVTMINSHTAPWGATSGNSESRIRKETICSAIAELCITTEYRIPLLMNPNSACAFTRANLEIALSMHTDTHKARHIKAANEPLLERFVIHWPDEIEIDTMKAQASTFDSVEENKRSVRIYSRKKDYDSIKRVIAALHSCPFAWSTATDSSLSLSKSRSVHPDIEIPLREIVMKLTECAFQHREQAFVSLDHVDLNDMTTQDKFIFDLNPRKNYDDDAEGSVEDTSTKKYIEKTRWTHVLFPASKNEERRHAAFAIVDVDMNPTACNKDANPDAHMTYPGDGDFPEVAQPSDAPTPVDAEHNDHDVNDSLARSALVPSFTQATPPVPRDDFDQYPISTQATQCSSAVFDADESMLDVPTLPAPTQMVDTQDRSLQPASLDHTTRLFSLSPILSQSSRLSQPPPSQVLNQPAPVHNEGRAHSKQKRVKSTSSTAPIPTSPTHRPPKQKRARIIDPNAVPSPSMSTPSVQQPHQDITMSDLSRVEEGSTMP
ncbi:hypothetical protein JVU11DRAFT_9304 [Chiua virens]|nr:hypothetical protein JVU11DRAFT_9304 [Chiua virens]